VKVEMFVRIAADSAEEAGSPRRRTYANACAIPDATPEQTLAANSILHLVPRPVLSPWSNSAAKRFFDCACVLAVLPLIVPILMMVAVAVWLTSEGPVFFRQQRVGRDGRLFTILKFRTIMHEANARCQAVTTDGNQPFTAIGPFLRRWKLDELPQIINILLGDMSLVGPRPKMPEHAIGDVPCRPGITGAATIAFAREETLLDRVPVHDLENYYHSVVLPTKRRLDAAYMARATFASDLKLIVNSVLRRWDDTIATRLLTLESLMLDGMTHESGDDETSPHWNSTVPIRVASVSARVGARRSA
jgi:lipopolysaccharide/colanic/teichoic acid biosynthesis glycosyltransferase